MVWIENFSVGKNSSQKNIWSFLPVLTFLGKSQSSSVNILLKTKEFSKNSKYNCQLLKTQKILLIIFPVDYSENFNLQNGYHFIIYKLHNIKNNSPSKAKQNRHGLDIFVDPLTDHYLFIIHKQLNMKYTQTYHYAKAQRFSSRHQS